jgi:hypothetical protein
MPQTNSDQIFDLESVDPAVVPTVTDSRVVPPETPELDKYDEKKASDDARRAIAYWLLALLIVTVLVAMIAVSVINGQPLDGKVGTVYANDAKADAERLVTVLNIVFGPVVTLLGTATGFYFGQQARSHPATGE